MKYERRHFHLDFKTPGNKKKNEMENTIVTNVADSTVTIKKFFIFDDKRKTNINSIKMPIQMKPYFIISVYVNILKHKYDFENQQIKKHVLSAHNSSNRMQLDRCKITRTFFLLPKSVDATVFFVI